MDTIQENEIFNLADKVDYQDGAFHPLVIDSNDKAEHVLMAVDKGVLIPDHKAPFTICRQYQSSSSPWCVFINNFQTSSIGTHINRKG